MKSFVLIIFIGFFMGTSFSVAKVDPLKKLKSQDPNRQGLEEEPSAISLLTEVIGPIYSPAQMASEKNRDRPELFLRTSEKNTKNRTKGSSSSTSE